MTNPNELSLVHATTALHRGTLGAEDLVSACLDRINARESTVRAWVHIDAEGAIAEARACDEEAAHGIWRGPLHGVPVGIKDIFDVAGMETRAGTDAWPPTRPTHDAASVARLRNAGAIILGKTVTTAFAMGDAGPTTNPWNTAHTPGGSSSGSAAAVADRMCLAALGSQTAGSVIRPCAFNGLAGIKPGHGRIDISGVLPLSWRLDHVGALTRNVADAALLWQVLRDDADWRNQVDMTGYLVPICPERPLRLWRMRDVFDSEATDDVRDMFEAHCAMLAENGVEVIERGMPEGFADVLDNHRVILAAEAAAAHDRNFAEHGDRYPPNIKETIEEGKTIDAVTYLKARQHRRQMIERFSRNLVDVDAAISPAATEPAPEGYAYTGKRSFNAPSSYLGMPVVSYPTMLNASGMPLAVQIMGSPYQEDTLLQIARWCETQSNFTATPT